MGAKVYLECTSGISGDMFVAAMLDLGIDREKFKEELSRLKLEGFRIRIREVNKGEIKACDFDVVLEEDNRDHDMEYLHGEGDTADCGEEHAQAHGHHRSFSDIKAILHGSGLKDRVKALALKIFGILARAEAAAHGVSEEEVHFHEVGAVDSIVDIVAAALCMDMLEAEEVIVPALYDGRGTVRCQHGILQVPVPAVRNIVQQHGLKLEILPVEGELVTPTGAAIVAALRTGSELPGKPQIIRSGIGAGKREYRTEGVLRAHLLA